MRGHILELKTMAGRYKVSFKFFDTEEQAQKLCNNENTNYYIRKKHPAYYTPWTSRDGKEHKFVAWYYTK